MSLWKASPTPAFASRSVVELVRFPAGSFQLGPSLTHSLRGLSPSSCALCLRHQELRNQRSQSLLPSVPITQ